MSTDEERLLALEQQITSLYALPLRNFIPFLVLLTTARDTTGKD